MDDDITAEHMQQLELKLLHTDWHNIPDQLDALIAEEFEEINSNGQVSSRTEVMAWLLNKNASDQWALTDFSVKVLTTDLVLSIYHAKKIGHTHENSRQSTRSSIWQRDKNRWRLVFHQASK